MGKEAEYLAQLQSLGIYEEAFRPAVHQLCIQERELSRVMKAWKATAPPGKSPSVLDPHYDVITKLRKDILVIRESLGLTPKGLQRIRGKQTGTPESEKSAISRKLDAIAERVSAYE